MKSRTLHILSLLSILSLASVPAKQVQMEVALANPQLEAGKKNTTYLKVGLTGFELSSQAERPPVNVALVIDKSGSMSGEKIRQAREAAKIAIGRLNEDDIVSLVAYDSTVNVLVPATKLTDKAEVLRRIDQLNSGGSTALFAGVSRGSAELRKFLDGERVNRVILLSDGKANVGPSSPGELGELGAALVKEGIAVSTIGLGLGYNEDLMAQLARQSDGNHIFIENEEQLVQVYDEEFGDILSVVAQEISIEINVAEGIRPVRVLGREADISGQHIVTQLNQLYSAQEKYVLLEIEVPEGQANASRDVATVEVAYANMETNTMDRLTSTLGVKFVASAEEVADAVNETVMVDSVTQIANATNIAAMKLRDQGKVQEAKDLLHKNYWFCKTNADWLESPALSQIADNNRIDAQQVEQSDAEWQLSRKRMVYSQTGVAAQQKGFTRGKNAESEIVNQLNSAYGQQVQVEEGAPPPPAPQAEPNAAPQQLRNVPQLPDELPVQQQRPSKAAPSKK